MHTSFFPRNGYRKAVLSPGLETDELMQEVTAVGHGGEWTKGNVHSLHIDVPS